MDNSQTRNPVLELAAGAHVMVFEQELLFRYHNENTVTLPVAAVPSKLFKIGTVQEFQILGYLRNEETGISMELKTRAGGYRLDLSGKDGCFAVDMTADEAQLFLEFVQRNCAPAS